MVEVYLPPVYARPIRCESEDDARLLFESVNADAQDELMMAALGSGRELRAIVVFADVTLSRIVDDPWPLVQIAIDCGARKVVFGHMQATPATRPGLAAQAQQVLRAALAVEGVVFDTWLTVPAYGSPAA